MSIRIRRIAHNTFEGLTVLIEQILQQYSTMDDSNGAANYRATFAFPSSHECILEQIFLSVGAATLTTGSGLDDLTSGGTYSGTEDAKIEVEVVDDAATPETYRWRKDGGDWSTPANMLATPTVISEGWSLDWNANVGHTDLDTWTFYVMIA